MPSAREVEPSVAGRQGSNAFGLGRLLGSDVDIHEHGRTIGHRLFRAFDARVDVPIFRRLLVCRRTPQAVSFNASACTKGASPGRRRSSSSALAGS
jgi:hypothetical protein